MANLKEIPNYNMTEWHNYLPPSIDQTNLNKLEENVNLNRDTINEIIRNLGIKPSGTSVDDSKIYDTPIYETLISLKNKIAALEKDKLDVNKYNSDLGYGGDVSNLIANNASEKTLIAAINNRLRKDTDDTTPYKCTFGSVEITSTSNSALNVAGGAKVKGALEANSITTSSLTVNGAATLSSLKVNNNAVISGSATVGSLSSSGAISAPNATLTNITSTGTISAARVEVSNIVKVSNSSSTWEVQIIPNGITCVGINASGAISCGSLSTSANNVTLNGHKLYVHGGSQSLNDTDAFIKTVS